MSSEGDKCLLQKIGLPNTEKDLVLILQSFIIKNRVLPTKRAGHLWCHLTDSSGGFYIVTLSLRAKYLMINLLKVQTEQFL